jgi:hypothetical protein
MNMSKYNPAMVKVMRAMWMKTVVMRGLLYTIKYKKGILRGNNPGSPFVNVERKIKNPPRISMEIGFFDWYALMIQYAESNEKTTIVFSSILLR